MQLVNTLNLYQTPDFSGTFDSGDADYLVAVTLTALGGSFGSIKFDGIDLTEIFSRLDHYDEPPTFSIELGIWTLPNPSQGSFTFDVDGSAAGTDRYAVTLFALKGVNPTTPVAGTAEDTHSGGGAFGLSISTPFIDSFGILFGTVYQNFAGFDYHIAANGFTRLVDLQGIQQNANGGHYVVYKIFTDDGVQILDGGHNNVDGSPTKSIEVGIILNGTQLGAAGSFFLLM